MRRRSCRAMLAVSVTLILFVASITNKHISPNNVSDAEQPHVSVVLRDVTIRPTTLGEVANDRTHDEVTQTSIVDAKHNTEGDAELYGVNNTAFHAILRQRASWNNTIILASVDSGYIDMAINLYFSSFQKHNVDNYLFVGSGPGACQILLTHSIVCFDYIQDRSGGQSSAYASKAFARKTHLKTKIIMEALTLGLNVLITDIDIVFLKNPLPLLNCHSCDIEMSHDGREGNSGFYLARPTPPSIKLHRQAWKQGVAKPDISNQKALDRNMEQMMKKGLITVEYLDPIDYPNGKVYFEDGRRMFKGDNPCTNCVIVHNNWIVSVPAKIYRFKECGMWENDRNKYYSNENNKYISFGLPGDYGFKDTRLVELRALKNALILGGVLDRIVILPQFHCYGCKYNPVCKEIGARCTFGTFYKMEAFDSELKDQYRESEFLRHSKVPVSIRESITPLYFIDTLDARERFPDLPANVTKLTPTYSAGVTIQDLVEWFGKETRSILRFHSLYDGMAYDEKDPNVGRTIWKLTRAIKESNYRQY